MAPGPLPCTEQLVRRGDERVGDVGARERDARNRPAHVDERRAADEQPHGVGLCGLDVHARRRRGARGPRAEGAAAVVATGATCA
jgi:hypothetical protein